MYKETGPRGAVDQRRHRQVLQLQDLQLLLEVVIVAMGVGAADALQVLGVNKVKLIAKVLAGENGAPETKLWEIPHSLCNKLCRQIRDIIVGLLCSMCL